jgi:hypothetical protein
VRQLRFPTETTRATGWTLKVPLEQGRELVVMLFRFALVRMLDHRIETIIRTVG